MSVDLQLAARMAKACYVTHFVAQPGGVSSCPNYAGVGLTSQPKTFVANVINAAVVGSTATEVVVAFRGTLPVDTANWDAFVESILDWVNDGDARLVPTEYTAGLVHQGFDHSLQLLWDEVLPAVSALHTTTKLPVIVTGHSKGGALAVLAALRLQVEAAITPIGVWTFGSPRVGNTQFALDYTTRILHSWRFENADDLVPHLPPTVLLLDFLAKADSRLANLSARDYHHVGLLEFLNWNGGVTEGSSFSLDAQRMGHLAELLGTGNVRKVATDHSLENEYIPRL